MLFERTRLWLECAEFFSQTLPEFIDAIFREDASVGYFLMKKYVVTLRDFPSANSGHGARQPVRV